MEVIAKNNTEVQTRTEEESFELVILRTDIKTKKKVKSIRPLFDGHKQIKKWSIDIEDIDNVLRMEVYEGLNESDVVHLIKTCGFQCEAL